MKFTEADIDRILVYQKDPFEFIYDMWGLEPQEAKKKYQDKWDRALKSNYTKDLKLRHFKEFRMWVHLTWHQVMIVNSIKKAMNWEADRSITIRSWHWIGKSMIMSLLVIWALFCFDKSQVPCTAPTKDQLGDVLRPEIKLWIDKMPDGYKEMFEVTWDYVRILDWAKGKEKNKRFARARTSSKERPEALAWVHSNSMVMLVADEASWVEDAVFDGSVGALTSPVWLMVLISNPTRLTGTFFKSHTVKNNWYQKLAFSWLESPVVNQSIVDKVIQDHWLDSDEYRIRILGEFPDAEWVDEQGWVRLIQDKDIKKTINWDIKPTRLGYDPAGSWVDESIGVVRDTFKAKVANVLPRSNAKKDASMINTLLVEYDLTWDRVWIDNFGIGANVAQELGLMGLRVNAVNVGEVKRVRDKKRFTNPRAECFWRMREWLMNWWELVNNKGWEDLAMIYYRRNTAGKIEIMGKKEMKKKFGKSPDFADALAYTFLSTEKEVDYTDREDGFDTGFSVDYEDEL